MILGERELASNGGGWGSQAEADYSRGGFGGDVHEIVGEFVETEVLKVDQNGPFKRREIC